MVVALGDGLEVCLAAVALDAAFTPSVACSQTIRSQRSILTSTEALIDRWLRNAKHRGVLAGTHLHFDSRRNRGQSF